MTLLVNCCRSVEENRQRVTECHERLQQLICSIRNLNHRTILLHNLRLLKDCGLVLSSVAPRYDFSPTVQGNGFRTALEIGLQFMRFGIKNLESGRTDFLPDYVKMSSVYVKVLPIIDLLMQACHKSQSLACDDVRLTCKLFHSYMRSEEELKCFFTEVGSVDSGPMGRTVFKILYFLRALHLAPNLSSLIRCITDRRYWHDLLFTACRKSTVTSMNRLVSGPLVNYVMRDLYPTIINGWNVCQAFDLSIPSRLEYSIRLDLDDGMSPVLHKNETPVTSSANIDCRIYLPNNGSKCTALMIYAHGGGFAVGDRYTSEVFHKHWMTRVPGLAILSFDYTLLPHARFPTQVHECLQVFSFFSDERNRHAVKEKIGFFPEKIFLSGDSAGACLAVSTTLVLSDIRKQFDTRQRLPDALFLFYPWLNIHPDVRPSFLVSGMTTLFHAAGFYNVMRSYIPVWESVDLNHNHKTPSRMKNNGLTRLPVISGLISVLKYIFNRNTRIPEPPVKACDASPRNLEQQVISSARLSKHPYVSPVYYEDWESVADVKLYMAVCSHDSLLDEAVVMGRKWKGLVMLDVLNNVQHAFLMLMMTQNSKQAADLIANRISSWM